LQEKFLLHLQQMQQYDYIIAGSGFAGGLLALTMRMKGRTVLLIDDATQSQCSRIAAGMLNPVNFRSLAPSWNAPILAPYAVDFYRQVEETFQKRIFTPRPLYRILNETEAVTWPETKPFFGSGVANPHPGLIHAPNGVAQITNGGNLSLAAINDLLAGNIHQDYFDETLLEITDTHIRYKNYQARAIIMCRGFRESGSALFPRISFQFLKGQLLQVRIPALKTDGIILGSGYLVPKNETEYLFGATHERELSDEMCTGAGKSELEIKLHEMFTTPFTVTGHLAGVRPTIRDHRPVLGLHPQHPRIAVFNGLGSKGSMQGPWLAEQLVQLLETGKPLMREIDVKRFNK
jgi:glycine oxidase